MIIEGKRFCNFCLKVIGPGQKHVQFKVPGATGNSDADYEHFHHRFHDDCWTQDMRKEVRDTDEAIRERVKVEKAAQS